MQINNNGSALKIDSFDNLLWSITPEVYKLSTGLLPKNIVLDTFKRVDVLPFTNVSIKFSHNTWDFSPILNIPKMGSMCFKFDEKSSYCDYLKMYVLNDILKKKTKIRTLKAKYSEIIRFIKYAETRGYKEFSLIPKIVYKDYYATFTYTYNTFCSNRSKLMFFVEFYEANFNTLIDTSIKKYLTEINTSKVKSIKEANKTPEIPIDYLNSFIANCKDIMYDKTASETDRITSAIMILYSQIGFRASELLGVKINSIKEEYSPDIKEPLRYLTFISYKNSDGDNGGTLAHTYINNLSYEAYTMLTSLCDEYRTNLGVDTLIVTKFQQNTFYNSKSLYQRFRMFMLLNNKIFKCININEIYPELKSYTIESILKEDEDGYLNIDISSDSLNHISMNDKLVIPTIHQFRVSVCTSLYRQGVPLNYIKKHMNHLTEDMTSYYIRPEKDLEKKYSESIYSAIIKGDSKLLGSHSKDFIDKVNNFIENLDINIQTDVNKVIELVANKYPLRTKVGGICIRCGDVIPCPSNDSSDSIYCAFGMCSNHCHMFFMADISYEEYLKHKYIIKYNKDNGFKKAYQKELNKLIYVIENSLLPELDELKNEIQRKGYEEIKIKYPQLSYIIDNYNEIYNEVISWK